MPQGPSHPNYKHGNMSKSLPDAVAARYRQAYNDEELLEIRGDVALFAARQGELAERVDTGEAGYLWRELREAWASLQASQNDAKKAGEMGDDAALAAAREKSAAALSSVGRMIVRGADNEKSWDELLTTTERLVRVKESEMRRLDRLNQVLTLEQVVIIFGQMHAALAASVKKRAPDDVSTAILTDVGNALRHWLACGQFQAHIPPTISHVAGKLDSSIPVLGDPVIEPPIEAEATPVSDSPQASADDLI